MAQRNKKMLALFFVREARVLKVKTKCLGFQKCCLLLKAIRSPFEKGVVILPLGVET